MQRVRHGERSIDRVLDLHAGAPNLRHVCVVEAQADSFAIHDGVELAPERDVGADYLRRVADFGLHLRRISFLESYRL